MTVLLDSSVWIEYWKGGGYADTAARYIDGNERALASAINVAEVHNYSATLITVILTSRKSMMWSC